MNITVTQSESRGLGAAAYLYNLLLASESEHAAISSVGHKFAAAIRALPEDMPETITVDVAEDEAAALVRAIDLIMGRDKALENVRTLLGGGETTPFPVEDEALLEVDEP